MLKASGFVPAFLDFLLFVMTLLEVSHCLGRCILIPVPRLPPAEEPWNSSGVGFFRDFRGRVKKA